MAIAIVMAQGALSLMLGESWLRRLLLIGQAPEWAAEPQLEGENQILPSPPSGDLNQLLKKSCIIRFLRYALGGIYRI